MIRDAQQHGAVALRQLTHVPPWDAEVILNLRLWCDGAQGQKQVHDAYHSHFPPLRARDEVRLFEHLIEVLKRHAIRPLVHHEVCSICAGADECVFAQLIATASTGNFNDAVFMATLMTGPSHAEHLAFLASEVGTAVRQMIAPRPSHDTLSGTPYTLPTFH